MRDPYSILKYFEYQHLPSHLQTVSQPFNELAHKLVDSYNQMEVDIPEAVTSLRKLLEAKDCAVRATILVNGN